MEELEEKFEKEYPRYSKALGIPLGIVALLITLITWGSFVLILFGCSPIITSPHGYVILINSHRVAVEHQDMNRPKNGVVRVYEFPFGHDYVVGDSVYILPKEH